MSVKIGRDGHHPHHHGRSPAGGRSVAIAPSSAVGGPARVGDRVVHRRRTNAVVSAIEIRCGSPLGEEWRDDAACKGQLHLFFPKKSERPEARARREARARGFCDVCPVRLACREYARRHRLHGFWGGESEEERHRAGVAIGARNIVGPD